jgi:hypothetical protein
MTYRRFKTGFRYYDVFSMLMDYSEDSSDWKYKRRGTVLGKWHQMKLEMWQEHVDRGACIRDPRNEEALNEIGQTAKVS